MRKRNRFIISPGLIFYLLFSSSFYLAISYPSLASRQRSRSGEALAEPPNEEAYIILEASSTRRGHRQVSGMVFPLLTGFGNYLNVSTFG